MTEPNPALPEENANPAPKGDPISVPNPVPPPKAVIVERWEKQLLYGLFAAFLVAMFVFLGNELATQQKNFEVGAKLARDSFEKASENMNSQAYRPDIALLYTFQFSRALDTAHLATAALILGSLIVCLGCLVVVYGVEANYQLTLSLTPPHSSVLTTSSPGLVLISLGALIIIATQFNHINFDTQVKWYPDPPTHAENQNPPDANDQ